MRITVPLPGTGRPWIGKIINWAENHAPMVTFGDKAKPGAQEATIEASPGDILWGGNKPKGSTDYPKVFFHVDQNGAAYRLIDNPRGLYKGPKDLSLYKRFSKHGRGNGGNPAPAPAPVPVPKVKDWHSVAKGLAIALDTVLQRGGKMTDNEQETVSEIMDAARAENLI